MATAISIDFIYFLTHLLRVGRLLLSRMSRNNGNLDTSCLVGLTCLTTIQSLRENGRQICPSHIQLAILSWQLIMRQRMMLLISTTALVTIMSLMRMAILRSHLPLTECTLTRIAASGP